MKRQIRRGVFETNSSSTHSLTMCSNETFNAWIRGEVLLSEYSDEFATREEWILRLKEKRFVMSGELYYPNVNWDDNDEVDDIFCEEGIRTYDDYMEDEYLETFEDSYTTQNGDVVVAFGKYGYEG